MSDDEGSPINRKRTRSGNESDRDDDRGRFKRRFNDSSRIELRLLIQSKDAGSIIGKGGDNIKRIRQDFKANVTVSDSRAPERIVTISGDIPVITDVCEEIFKTFEEKYKTGRRDYEVEVKALIHQSQAGCVIGKAGSKLKEFRQDYSVDIKVYSECCPRSTERIVQIAGKVHNAKKCISAILDLLRTWPPKGYNNPYDPSNYDDSAVRDYGGYADDNDRGGRGRDRNRGGDYGRRGSGGSRNRERERDDSRGASSSGGLAGSRRSSQQVSIPADLAGVIIGKGGQNIKQIRQDSGADVDLSDPSGDGGDRIITITGSPDQIQNAQYMLQMSVKQHLSRESRDRDGGRR